MLHYPPVPTYLCPSRVSLFLARARMAAFRLMPVVAVPVKNGAETHVPVLAGIMSA